MNANALRLDHVLIAVRELDQTPSIFGDKLGFKLTPEGRHPGRASHNRLIVFGSEYLELIGILDPTEPVFRPNMVKFLESREGLFIFALGTDDINSSVAALRKTGVAVEDPIPGARHAQDGTISYSWSQSAIDVAATPGSQTFFIQHHQSLSERYTEPNNPTEHPNGVLGIDHLTLAVHDADSAAARWQTMFNLPRGYISQITKPGKASCVRLKLHNCFLDFVSSSCQGHLADFLRQNGEAPLSLALRVRNLKATIDYLAARGIRPTKTGTRTATINAMNSNSVPITLLEID